MSWSIKVLKHPTVGRCSQIVATTFQSTTSVLYVAVMDVFAGRISIASTSLILKKCAEQSLLALKSWPYDNMMVSILAYLYPVEAFVGDSIELDPSIYPNDKFT